MTGYQQDIPITNVDGPLLGTDPTRLSIAFGTPATGHRYTVSFGAVAVLDQGITIWPSNTVVILTHRDFG